MARKPETVENPDLERSMRKSGIEEGNKTTKREPVYRVVGDSRIPVTKAHGAMWKSRFDAGSRKSRDMYDAWQEAVAYYMNTADDDRENTGGRSARNITRARHLTDAFCEIENVVFANTTALVPLTYSKNPVIEATATNKLNDGFARSCEHLGNALLVRKAPPNFNAKSKMRRAIVLALLASCAYMEIGWTTKEDSSESAVEDLMMLAEELKNAKDVKTIIEVEGKLEALEQSVDLLRAEGPFARLRLPWEIVRDPAGIEEDFSDSRWVMIADMIPNSVIRAKYATKKPDGTYASVYKPTHILNLRDASDATGDETIDSFSLFSGMDGSDMKDGEQYGFADPEAFDRAQYTKVWMVWDKTTRRVLMYNDLDWSWPIWVWDDPYGLDSFFPLEGLHFQVSPTGGDMKGEVSYYLDQQDAINEINSEKRRARRWAQRNIIYNSKRINKEEAEALLKGDKDQALGVPLNEGEKINDVIDALMPPSMQYSEIFDKSDQMQAIDRLSSVSDILRGAQFKTNTTEDAVETYNSVAQTRQDEKIDLVEDFIGGAMWKVMQLCIQFMSPQRVQSIIGAEKASGWRNIPPNEIADTLSMRIVGGSIVKPTAANKKRQALEVGQILGQFASASPVAFLIAAKVFEQAFDEVVITAEDWQLIQQAIEAQLQPTGGGEGQALDQIAQQIDALPPEAKRAIGTAIARGAPVAQVIEQVLGATQQEGNGNATQQPRPAER